MSAQKTSTLLVKEAKRAYDKARLFRNSGQLIPATRAEIGDLLFELGRMHDSLALVLIRLGD